MIAVVILRLTDSLTEYK